MYFHEIWNLLKTGKFKAKRKDWNAYWTYGNNTIWVHCSDGRVLDIRDRDTENVEFTFNNIAASDWQIVLDLTICIPRASRITYTSCSANKDDILDDLKTSKEFLEIAIKALENNTCDYDCKKEIIKCWCDLNRRI